MMASNMTKAIMVARTSVIADSKASMFFAFSDIVRFLTRPNTMMELEPPTMLPSRMLSSHSQPIT